jgi:protein tyrosine phosphatase (PTP) superfamily phosphohydrolase (DUF442 family)
MEASDILRDDAHRFAPAARGEPHVFGACSPGWHSAGDHGTAVDEWIGAMQAQGMERVLCLLPGRELDRAEANIGLYREAFGTEAVRHAPVPDHHLADLETLRRDVLPFLEASAAADAPVVVHCLAGIGRTGQVLSAWLVSGRGYDPHEAVDTVVGMGRDPMEAVREGNATRQDLLDLLGLLT